MSAEALEAAVRDGGLLARERPVLVMISGGRDSTCLLDLAVRIAGAPAVAALHMNYGLREEAGEDERHCRALCARLGVALAVRCPQQPRRGNLHAWARAERYAAAAALAGPGREIAVGHTASDQVETVLYRLASSPSRRAVLGMAAREGAIVRPLLEFTRAQTAAYCRDRGLAWREDASNDAPAFARARVRHRVLPALREVHPAAERNVLALAARLREEGAVLDGLVADVLDGAREIELERLRALPVAVARLVVQRLADEAAGRPAAGVGRRTDELLGLAGHGVAMLDVGCGLRAVCTRGRLRFEPLPPRTGPECGDANLVGEPRSGSRRPAGPEFGDATLVGEPRSGSRRPAGPEFGNAKLASEPRSGSPRPAGPEFGIAKLASEPRSGSPGSP